MYRNVIFGTSSSVERFTIQCPYFGGSLSEVPLSEVPLYLVEILWSRS